MIDYPNLNTIFLLFFSYFYFFSFLFLLRLSTFKTAKRTAFKVWAIENIREDYSAIEIGGATLGGPFSIGSPKNFEVLNRYN